ncbi:hypothetical protein NEOLEDRAFT_670555 [Neolentinus lepideus HHB14362 ss-1]|uniref:Uncharacterized protein n=1 Tax=Neolentinus lepideus HHB14362 ss-1 TaxID=1314782 RepID=A0A165QAY8_9AGAM|nr:hypothetical protein NEOLEDRAFT_670555 [Neolentinus lepideus HHB14362 ss-1]
MPHAGLQYSASLVFVYSVFYRVVHICRFWNNVVLVYELQSRSRRIHGDHHGGRLYVGLFHSDSSQNEDR